MSRKNVMLRGGIALLGNGTCGDCPAVESLPQPDRVTIPLLQHSGRPAAVCVSNGDHVAMGQLIGRAEEPDACPVHASVSGRVVSIDRYPFSADPDALMVTIENNGQDEFASPIPYDKPLEDSTPEELLLKIAHSGIVDDDGTPLHRLCSAARGGAATVLLISGLTTEPFMHARQRLLLDRAQEVVDGTRILMRMVGAAACLVVIDEKSPDLAAALSAHTADATTGITLLPVRPKYPYHQPDLLRRACAAITGDAAERSVVIGAEAAAALRDALHELRPHYERIVTVAGGALPEAKNFLVRIGTPVGALMDACGADVSAIKKLVAGGPLSGDAIHDLTYPVVKTMNALLAFDSSFLQEDHDPCIRCGQCRMVCPAGLEPARLIALVAGRELHEAGTRALPLCTECGSCAYVCPSRIDLVHWLRYGKFLLQRDTQVPPSFARTAA